MVCIVITRNGEGNVYTFKDKLTARLHPVAQMYDVFAGDANELTCQFGRDDIDSLLRFAEGRDKSRLIDAMERWKSEPGSRHLPSEDREILWRLCIRSAQILPSDPMEIIRIIEEDRRFMEQRPVRSRSESTSTGEFSPQTRMKGNDMTEATKKPRASRVSDDATIKILVDKNPKREGSKSAERFSLYKNGMTVKQAKEAGITAADIAYDSDTTRKDGPYISVTAPEPAPAAE